MEGEISIFSFAYCADMKKSNVYLKGTGGKNTFRNLSFFWEVD